MAGSRCRSGHRHGDRGWWNGEAFHDGIDLATFCGDRIKAAHAGKVLAAGRRYDSVMGWIGDLQSYYDRLDAQAPLVDAADRRRHR